MAGNKILREDIAEDKVFSIGTDYARNLEVGIQANSDLLKSFAPLKEAILSLADASEQFKKAGSNQAFIAVKKQEAIASKQAADAVKNQQDALVAAEKAKQAIIETEKKHSAALVATEKARQASLATYKKEAELTAANQKAKQASIDTEAKLIKLAEQKKAIEASNASEADKKQQILALSKQENQLTEQSVVAKKEQQKIEAQLIRVMQQKQIAGEGTNRQLQLEKLELQQVNQKAKEYAILSSKLSTEYQKQAVRLEQLRKEYKDLALRQQLRNDLSKEEVVRMQQLYKEAGKLDAALKKVDADVGQYQRNVGNYSSALGNLGNTARSLVGAFGITSGAAIFAQIVKGAIQNVKEFDSGLKNVQKTTGLTKPEIKELGDDIVTLSRKLETVGTKSLLEYATVAGQLGVKGSANILAFTETLAKLETASDISGEEGGASIARLLTLVDGGVQNVGNFGDEIVKLGNNFAATEGEILDNATAIAQNTGIYKLGRQAVLAYATATKAVGIESEVTGSTIGRTLGLLEKAIRTGEGLEEITALTGKSVLELKQQFKDDAGSVFTDLIRGLNAVDKAGGSVNERLENLGIVAIRDQRVIGSLASAGFETLERSMRDVADASGSLGQEFETASGKLENQFNRVGIAWDNLVLTIEKGDGFISKSVIKTFASLADSLDAISEALNGNQSIFQTWLTLFQSTYRYANIGTALFSLFSKETKNVSDSANEASIALEKQNKQFADQYGSIQPLNEALTEQVKLREQLNILTGAGAFEDPTQDFGAQAETIKDLRDQIKALNEEVEGMNTSDAAGIKIKLQEVAVLQKKLDALLGVTKGTRKAAKEQKDFIFETNKLINETKLKFLQDFANDEKRDFDLRQVALKTAADLELSLVDYVLTEKLKKVKKGSDEEKFLLVQAESEKQAIVNKFNDGSDKIALDKIKSYAETKAAIQEKLLNEELTRENEFFATTKDQYKTLEEATEAHEKRVAAIKKKYAIQALQDQITAIEALLQSEAFSADERIQLEAKIGAYKQAISELNKELYKKDGKERVMTEKEVAQEILRISGELANAIGDIINNLSDARIQRIEDEIQASNEKYDTLLEDENLYEEDRKRIEEAKENARKKLEREIAKEKRKQAILDKALAAVQIGINTAVNISEVAPNPILIALVAALGAAQLAAIAATPIPSYEKGTENHKGGFAEVAEKRPEVITEPGKKPYVVSKRSILNLPKGTKVTPSLEEYEKLQRASILASLHISNEKMNDFQAKQIFDSSYKEFADEMKLTRETIKKSKPNLKFISQRPPDIPHEFFRFKNINWRG